MDNNVIDVQEEKKYFFNRYYFHYFNKCLKF